MNPGPPKMAERIVSAVVPPACREEVTGDLHERYQSPAQYVRDALRTVPLVILSRARRTTDPQVLVIQVFAFYISFLGPILLVDRVSVYEPWGLLQIAVGTAMGVAGLVLEDVYARPGGHPALALARGPLLGTLLALASQEMLLVNKPGVPAVRWVVLYGGAASLLLSSAVRVLFPAVRHHLLDVSAEARSERAARASKSTAGVSAPAIAVALMIVALIAMVAYQMFKRG